MKKMMFNEPFGLEQAVINGTKDMTRRILTVDIHNLIDFKSYLEGDQQCAGEFECGWVDWRLVMPYKLGEVIAIAQRYADVPINMFPDVWYAMDIIKHSKGWSNKMFVSSKFMPHKIQITDMKLERLQDISNEDCLREGIYAHTVELDEVKGVKPYTSYSYNATQGKNVKRWWYKTPREAYAALVDKLYGKGTWESNPWVVAYTFKRV